METTFFPFDFDSSAGREVGASLADRLDDGVASLVVDLGGILSMYLCSCSRSLG